MRPIPAGYYKPSTTTNDPTICPANNQCTSTATTSCPTMKYSASGWGYCVRVPIGYYTSGTNLLSCSGTRYTAKTSACGTCSNAKCDQYTDLEMSCPVGYYFSTSSTMACTICQAGYYCDGTSRTAASQNYPTRNTGAPDNAVACPPGYKCTSTSGMTAVSNGFYSLYAVSGDTEQQYVMHDDLYVSDVAGNCPSDSYKTSYRRRCSLSTLGQ